MRLERGIRMVLKSDTPVSRLMSTAHVNAELVRGLPSVHALTSVREATHFMASKGVLQIHVRDTHGDVVGVLTASDLYRWVTEAPTDYEEVPMAGHA
jgi:CBS domain-containing protein